jgi:DNA-binding response OmpR family regulator
MALGILVVDDEEAIGFALRRYFERRGFRVDVAMALEEAQALVAERDYGVVVVDLRLRGRPGGEGLDLLRYVRRVQPRARCILLSAGATDAVKQAANEQGVDVVLRKPVALMELGQVVQRLIERRHDG